MEPLTENVEPARECTSHVTQSVRGGTPVVPYNSTRYACTSAIVACKHSNSTAKASWMKKMVERYQNAWYGHGIRNLWRPNYIRSDQMIMHIAWFGLQTCFSTFLQSCKVAQIKSAVQYWKMLYPNLIQSFFIPFL